MPKDYILKHVYSPLHRSAIIDNAIITMMTDRVGETVSVVLTRMDAHLVSETAIQQDDGAITLRSDNETQHEFIRSIEFTAMMRPDQAKNILASLKTSLRGLTDEQKKKYGITEKEVAE